MNPDDPITTSTIQGMRAVLRDMGCDGPMALSLIRLACRECGSVREAADWLLEYGVLAGRGAGVLRAIPGRVELARVSW